MKNNLGKTIATTLLVFMLAGCTMSRAADPSSNTSTSIYYSPSSSSSSSRTSSSSSFTSSWSVATYRITWKNWDGTILETDWGVRAGTMPTYDGATPTKPAEGNYSYVFDGWSPNVVPAVADAVYTAKFSRKEPQKFTVTWKNWDGSVLETDRNVAYGSMPSYDGTTPQRSSADGNIYTFSNWSPALAKVTADVIYTAEYEAVSAVIDNGYHRSVQGDGTIKREWHSYQYESSDSSFSYFRCTNCGHRYAESSHIFDPAGAATFVNGECRINTNKLMAIAQDTIVFPYGLSNFPLKCFSGGFANNRHLKYVFFPSSLTSFNYSGADAPLSLPSMTKLEGVYFPPSVELDGLPNYMFEGCSSLRDVSFPSLSNATLGFRCFQGCGFETLEIPEGVVEIKDYAFHSNKKLKAVRLPSSLEKLGMTSGPFVGCSALERIDVDPKNSNYLSRDGVLFGGGLAAYPSGRSDFVCYKIPDGVGAIRQGAIGNTKYLRSVIMPLSIKRTYFHSFYNDPAADSAFHKIFYEGIYKDFAQINREKDDIGMGILVYFYSETQPPADQFDYWHYVNGEPTPW